jgi:hypothetical protein
MTSRSKSVSGGPAMRNSPKVSAPSSGRASCSGPTCQTPLRARLVSSEAGGAKVACLRPIARGVGCAERAARRRRRRWPRHAAASGQRETEDRALEAAHANRQAGKRALVVAQTSNELLDELNARAQAIRAQDGELGAAGLTVTGRPYALHTGDQIQVRAPSRIPSSAGSTTAPPAASSPSRKASERWCAWPTGVRAHGTGARRRRPGEKAAIAAHHRLGQGVIVAITPPVAGYRRRRWCPHTPVASAAIATARRPWLSGCTKLRCSTCV